MAQNVFQVPITKGGPEAVVEVDTSTLSDEMYAFVLMEGLKTILNARMSGDKVGAITKLTGDDLAKANAAAMRIAGENRDRLLAGEIKAKGKRAKSDVPREVQTHARRIARDVVKNEMRKAGIKQSQVAAKDITAAADALIAQDPSYLEKARAYVDSQTAITSAIDVSALVHVDPKKVAKAAEAKANRPLSAKQSGMVAPRKKPAAQAGAAIH